MEKNPDKDIINNIRSADKEKVDETMLYLYQRMYPIVVNYIQKNSGVAKDAADVFQDGLVAFYKKVRANEVWEETNVEAYLYSTCRNLWLKKLQKRQREVELTDVFDVIPVGVSQEEIMLSKERLQLMDQILQKLGDGCYRLLSYVYYDQLRLRKIAELMGFASEQVAKNKKSKCMKKLKKLMKENPHFKDLLKP